jgi:hypothetical protein
VVSTRALRATPARRQLRDRARSRIFRRDFARVGAQCCEAPAQIAGPNLFRGELTMKKLTRTPTRPTLTLTSEVVRTLSIDAMHHVVGGGLRPAPTNRSCGTGETTYVLDEP